MTSRWYHTIDLPDGPTPGIVDLRGVAPAVLPARLDGQRCLDVGTFDGFWAFAMEQRGAREVVALDLERAGDADWPPPRRAALEAQAAAYELELGAGFRHAHAALRSQVERIACPVQRLTAEAVGEPFDVAFLGALLLHLRDPVGALERVRAVLRPGGRLIVLEAYDPLLTLLHPRRPRARFGANRSDFTWWLPNLRCLGTWLTSAGFTDVRRTGLHRPPAREGMAGTRYAAHEGSAPHQGSDPFT